MISRIRASIAPLLASLALLMGIGFSVLVQPATVGAAPVDVLQKCNSDSKVCQGTGRNSLFTLVENIINLLLTVIGIIAVIMIIIGGIRYTTSAGDPGQAKSARDTIIYAIVGLVVAIMSYALVNWVLGRL